MAHAESDASLVARVLGGDAEAFAGLYDRYAPLVRAIGHETTRNLDAAQDLCQETFLRAYRKLGSLREPEKFAGWLVAIARHAGSEWRRSRGRDRLEFTDQPLDRPLPGTEAKTGLGSAPGARMGETDPEDLAWLHTAMAGLPEDQRLALHLFYLQEQPAEQARQVLGVSSATFYRLLTTARQALEAMARGQEVRS